VTLRYKEILIFFSGQTGAVGPAGPDGQPGNAGEQGFLLKF
jgi:hypothetical protein